MSDVVGSTVYVLRSLATDNFFGLQQVRLTPGFFFPGRSTRWLPPADKTPEKENWRVIENEGPLRTGLTTMIENDD
jgi:hypothetical protein